MAYKLRHPQVQSGSIQCQGKFFEIRNWEFEADDLHSANYLVEHSGCILLGVERTKMAKRIIVKRLQGLGDVLMMTPVMRKIKEINPECYITYACAPMFMDLVKHLPYIDRIVETPQLGYHKDECWVTEADGSRTMSDYWVNCDGIAERADEKTLSTVHRVDLFAQIAGVELKPEERRLDYVVTKEEYAWAAEKFKEFGIMRDEKVLGMAVRSTARNRNMDAVRFRQIAEMAASAGWRTMVFDHDALFGWEGNGVINMTGKTTIREMAALLSHCDMFFGPDSGAWHLASALNVPNVVYFGAMDWKLRVTMPRTKVIYRNVQCYPCNRYDCHWQNKYECVDISAERCWATVEAYDIELGTRKSPRVEQLVPVNVKPGIVVEDSGHKDTTPEMIEQLRRGTYVH